MEPKVLCYQQCWRLFEFQVGWNLHVSEGFLEGNAGRGIAIRHSIFGSFSPLTVPSK